MITSDKISFKASKYAPNFREVEYWIDLNEGPDGQIIKCYSKGKWIPINYKQNEDQSQAISELQANKVDKTTYNQFVQNNNNQHSQINTTLDSKADKSSTLSGYGITNAYTKTETDSKIEEKISQLVNSAPETLNTLDELAAALGDDPNFATTTANLIGTKLSTETYNAEKINFASVDSVNTKITGNGINTIQVVTELPEQQLDNILYIVIDN